MSNTSFWKPVYQLFKPEKPLTTSEDLKNFYVQRTDSPVEVLVTTLEMEDDSTKFLLAGHIGSGKTTELRRLKEELDEQYTVIWIDTETALERYNIGYAEVVVLIGQEICRQAIQPGWWSRKDERLLKALENSLKTVIYQDKKDEVDGLELPEVLKKMGMTLKLGLTREMTRSLNVRPILSEIISRVNDIIKAAEKDRKQKLLVLVDGLDRHEEKDALEMFSSSLLTELDCHIVYSIPISLRYSPSFRQPKERFQNCLDLTNPPVFECDQNFCPTANPNRVGRDILISVINKRLLSLGHTYKNLFHPEALELICEKSGGVIRDLVRLALTSCSIASRKNLSHVDLAVAQEAVQEERRAYNLSDYHFPEMDKIHRTGRLTTEIHKLPNKGEFVICDELLKIKHILGYYDASHTSWFDVNPILIEELKRWQAANPPQP
jgi:hypothetical protein